MLEFAALSYMRIIVSMRSAGLCLTDTCTSFDMSCHILRIFCFSFYIHCSLFVFIWYILASLCPTTATYVRSRYFKVNLISDNHVHGHLDLLIYFTTYIKTGNQNAYHYPRIPSSLWLHQIMQIVVPCPFAEDLKLSILVLAISKYVTREAISKREFGWLALCLPFSLSLCICLVDKY